MEPKTKIVDPWCGPVKHVGHAPMASLDRLNSVDTGRLSAGDKAIRFVLGAMTSVAVIIVVVIVLKVMHII